MSVQLLLRRFASHKTSDMSAKVPRVAVIVGVGPGKTFAEVRDRHVRCLAMPTCMQRNTNRAIDYSIYHTDPPFMIPNH